MNFEPEQSLEETVTPVVEPSLKSKVETPFPTSQVLTIAGGHFTHDTFSAFLAPVLPILQERLATNYALTGGLAIFTQAPSLLNPLIGYLADRVSLRYFIILAPGVTATIMSAIGLTGSYLSLALLLLLGGVSIAAFHSPAPAMIGRVTGDQIGRGMSYYMAAGELGRTVGPLVVAGGIEWFGLGGIWRLSILGWIVSLVLFVRLRSISARPSTKSHGSMDAFWPKARRYFPILAWLMAARIFMMVGLTTFLPIYMSDVVGAGLWLSAASLTFLEGAGVVGALTTGTLSDRLGRRRVLFALLSTSPLLMLLFINVPEWLTVPMLIALGLIAISPTPVLLASVQDEFPDNRALANGAFLALNFLIRAAGVWIVGAFADRFGLVTAFSWSAVVAFAALPAVWLLPRRRIALLS